MQGYLRLQPLILPRAGGTHGVVVAARDDEMLLLLRLVIEKQAAGYFECRTEDEAVLLSKMCRPAIVVLDGDLGAGSALEACRRLKQDAQTRGAAVVLVSAWTDAASRAQAHEAGVDAFIAKPFKTGDLSSVVTTLYLVGQRRSADAGAKAARVANAG